MTLPCISNITCSMPRRRPQKSRDRRNSYAQSQLSGSKSPSSSSLNRLNRRAHKYSENERHRDNRDQQDVEMMEDENGANNWGGAKSGYSPYESEMNQLQPRQRQHAKSEDDIEYAQPGNSSVMKRKRRGKTLTRVLSVYEKTQSGVRVINCRL